jgi:fibronectin type 3 domain-containing protein
MKFFRLVFLLVSLLMFVSIATAQPFLALLEETTEQLDSICGGTDNPLSDGTTILIYWDSDSNGPSDNDPLAVVCDNPPDCLDGPPGTVNFNSFSMNGVAEGYLPGQFYQWDPVFRSVNILPTPDRYYLVICQPTRHWVSAVFSPASNYGEYEMGPWTCVNTPCPGCPIPQAPEAFIASDSATCVGVNLTWSYPDTVSLLEGFNLYREGVEIGQVGPGARTYTDLTAVSGNWYNYGIKARRNCTGDVVYSSLATDHGSILPAPQPPVNITATQNACSTVTVTWSFSSLTGLEAWVIKRGADSVGTVPPGTPGTRNFVHHTALAGPAQYSVCGWNHTCGIMNCSVSVTGEALQRPPQIQNVQATDAGCDSTYITWTDVATETSYQVWRSLNDGTQTVNLTPTGLPANTVHYRDQTGLVGTTYRYWVIGVDLCGSGVASAYDTGSRLIAPDMPTNFTASDSSFCDRVHMTWTNMVGNQGYKIVRTLGATVDTLGPVPQDTIHYEDLTAVPGIAYNYNVLSFNTCGSSLPSATNSGSRRSLPAQVTGVVASDTNCTGVVVQWSNVANEDSFRIYRNTVQIGHVAADVLTYLDATAVPGTTYSYTVAASNACGAGTVSNPDDGTRAVSLAQVTGLTATTNLCTGVNLAWNTLTDADSFVIMRDGTTIATEVATVLAYSDTDVNGGLNYNYTVAGWNHCGLGPVSAIVVGYRVPQPPAITGLTATNNSCAAVTITWTTVAGADSFQVRRNGNRIGVTGSTGSSFSDADATPGTVFQYTVVSYNVCGIGPVPTAVSGERTIPEVPSGLAASTNRCDLIHLTWQPVSPPVQIYRIYKNSILIGFTDSVTTFFNDASVGVGSYNYTVTAYSTQCLESAQPTPVTGTLQPQPTPVSNVQVTTNRCDGVNITWTAGTGGFDGFLVRRGATVIDSAAGTAASFFDSLAPVGNSDYSVRPYSVYCNQPVYSTPVTGTRTPMPVAPSNVVASTNLCNTVHITWTDLTDETGYHVYRDSVLIKNLGANVVSAYDSAGSAGNHNYAVVGINACGEGQRSTPVVGTVNAIPAQVTSIAATQDSCSLVIVNWTDVAQAQYYRIYRDAVLLDSVSQGIGHFTNTGLTPGSYNYTLEAVNFCGTGTASVPVAGRVENTPAVVTGIAATNNLCYIAVTWTDLDNERHYDLYRDSNLLVTLAENTVGYNDSTATIGVHQYALLAVNQCGDGTMSGDVPGERQGPPTEVTTVTGPDSACATGTATLDWTTVTLATGYIIYRDGTRVDSVGNVLTYQATATAGNHTFAVAGADPCGIGPVSTEVTVRFKAVPPQVNGVIASADNCSGITISWGNVAGETGYHVYRDGTLIATIGPDTLTYSDTAATVGTHPYHIAAFNECGEGTSSANSNGIRLGPPAIVTNLQASDDLCSEVDLTWNDVANEVRYVILRDNARLDSVNNDITSYTDLTAVAGTTYQYRVFALNDCGHGDTSVANSGLRVDVPVQVTGVAATSNRCDGINVTWSNIVGELKFWIYRNATVIDSVNADVLVYLDTNAPVGVQQSYTVAARNACGFGPQSAAATGTRLQSPGVPASIATHDSCGMVQVSWGAAPGDVDNYKVYRGATMVGQVGSTVFTYLDAVAAGTYSYTVVAHSTECGDGQPTAGQNGTSHALGVPTNLAAAAAMCDSTRITWTASTGDVQRYRIYRDGVLIDSTTSAVRYVDTNVHDAANHSYTVTAYSQWCGATAAAGPVTAHLLPLVAMTSNVADPVHCGNTIYIHVSHCAVDNVHVLLSLNNGNYGELSTVTTVGDSIAVVMPDTTEQLWPNSHVLFISHRGTRTDSATSNVFTMDCRLGVDMLDANSIPNDFFLDQNYPNPFNPSTAIRYGVPRQADVKLSVFDVLGREVAVIHEGAVQPGIHTIYWDCSGCPSGMYLVRLQTGDRIMMRKMLLMK